jgi:hypothetical protein
MDAAIVSKLCDTTGPRRPCIDIGVMNLAFCTYVGAVEDVRGRALSGQSDRTKRNNAALALRWLREGLRPGPLAPVCSLRWCAHVLDVDPKWLVWNGVARIPLSGLKHWRQWRADFGKNRLAPKPVTLRPCAHCGREMRLKTFHCDRKYCSAGCMVAHRRLGKARVDPFHSYQCFCSRVGVQPLTRSQWGVLCG